jgi:hypothetical protein
MRTIGCGCTALIFFWFLIIVLYQEMTKPPPREIPAFEFNKIWKNKYGEPSKKPVPETKMVMEEDTLETILHNWEDEIRHYYSD